MNGREEWGIYDLGEHTITCEVWDNDDGVCTCSGADQKWRGRNRGVPHPNWFDGEVVRRLLSNEPVGRPVSEAEAKTAIPRLVNQGLSVLEMSERMSLDRRRVDKMVKEVS